MIKPFARFRCILLMLVFLFSVFQSSFQWSNQSKNNLSLVSHSLSDEKDPCHRKIYHHDESAECHHSEHYTANYSGFQQIDLFHLNFFSKIPDRISFHPALLIDLNCAFGKFVCIPAIADKPGRGPPFVV